MLFGFTRMPCQRRPRIVAVGHPGSRSGSERALWYGSHQSYLQTRSKIFIFQHVGERWHGATCVAQEMGGVAFSTLSGGFCRYCRTKFTLGARREKEVPQCVMRAMTNWRGEAKFDRSSSEQEG